MNERTYGRPLGKGRHYDHRLYPAAGQQSEFDIDEDCLAIAASLYTQFTLSQLGV